MENLISQNSKQVMNSVGNSQERVRPENWVEMVTEHEYDYTSGNPAVYVGTYYKHNCGSLYGMWVDLTSFLDYDDFMEFCHLLHIDEKIRNLCTRIMRISPLNGIRKAASMKLHSTRFWSTEIWTKRTGICSMPLPIITARATPLKMYASVSKANGTAKRSSQNSCLMIVIPTFLSLPVAISILSSSHAICSLTITPSAMDMYSPIID